MAYRLPTSRTRMTAPSSDDIGEPALAPHEPHVAELQAKGGCRGRQRQPDPVGGLAEHEGPTGVVDDQRDRVEGDAPAHAPRNGRTRVEDSRDEDEDGQC